MVAAKDVAGDTRVATTASFIMGVIIFNAILLGLETSKPVMASFGPLILALDTICLGIFVTEIILKLWPVPARAATFAVPEAAAALRTAYQPLAVLESHDGSFVYAEGSQATIEVLSRQLSSEPDEEHVWPSPWSGEVLVSLRVPPRRIAEGVAIAREVHASWWVAQHGVGRIDVGFDRLDRNDLDAMRRKVATLGGVLRPLSKASAGGIALALADTPRLLPIATIAAAGSAFAAYSRHRERYMKALEGALARHTVDFSESSSTPLVVDKSTLDVIDRAISPALGGILGTELSAALAGMEGALVSVIGGLTSCPVVAVPTSVGYGAGLDGVTALLAMLASCASGVSVVGIDNGFGAASAVVRVLRT